MCDIVVMMTKWKQSKGAQIEHEEAVRLGKEIQYL
jgi:hypothetical protein